MHIFPLSNDIMSTARSKAISPPKNEIFFEISLKKVKRKIGKIEIIN
jgi:hypothetical protein